MTRAKRLPLHPRPLPYEALSSWADRLAAAYDLERYEFLRAMLGADPPPERVRAMTLAGYTPSLIDGAVPSAGLFEAYVCVSLAGSCRPGAALHRGRRLRSRGCRGEPRISSMLPPVLG